MVTVRTRGLRMSPFERVCCLWTHGRGDSQPVPPSPLRPARGRGRHSVSVRSATLSNFGTSLAAAAIYSMAMLWSRSHTVTALAWPLALARTARRGIESQSGAGMSRPLELKFQVSESESRRSRSTAELTVTRASRHLENQSVPLLYVHE